MNSFIERYEAFIADEANSELLEGNTLYHITDKGHAELDALMHDVLTYFAPVDTPETRAKAQSIIFSKDSPVDRFKRGELDESLMAIILFNQLLKHDNRCPIFKKMSWLNRFHKMFGNIVHNLNS